MKPIAVDGLTNFTYHLPGKPGEGLMPCRRNLDAVGVVGQGTVTTYWVPEPGDDVTAATLRIHYEWPDELTVRAAALTDPDEAGSDALALEELRMVAFQGGRQGWITLDEEPLALLVLEVAMVPPPAVMVWLDE